MVGTSNCMCQSIWGTKLIEFIASFILSTLLLFSQYDVEEFMIYYELISNSARNLLKLFCYYKPLYCHFCI